jgi:hypothetical protein
MDEMLYWIEASKRNDVEKAWWEGDVLFVETDEGDTFKIDGTGFEANMYLAFREVISRGEISVTETWHHGSDHDFESGDSLDPSLTVFTGVCHASSQPAYAASFTINGTVHEVSVNRTATVGVVARHPDAEDLRPWADRLLKAGFDAVVMEAGECGHREIVAFRKDVLIIN